MARSDLIDLGHPIRSALSSYLTALGGATDPRAASECHRWADVFDWYGTEILLAPPTVRAFGEHGSASGSQVRLRGVVPEDVGSFYMAATDPKYGHRWRYRGRTPSFEEFENSLFVGVLCQFAVVAPASPAPVGLAVAYNADLSAKYAYIGLLRVRRDPEALAGAMIEGAALLIAHVFAHWPVDRILMELPDYNMALVESLIERGIAFEEARIRDYIYYNGRTHDQVIVAITRQSWSPLETWFG